MGLLTKRVACRYQFSLVGLTFSVALQEKYFFTFDQYVAKIAS